MAAGAAETIALGLFRARGFVLLAVALAAIGSAVLIGRHELPSSETGIRVLAALAAVWVVGFVHLRHFLLSGLAAIAPLPGLLIVFAISGDFASITMAYTLGVIAALFAADEIAARIAGGLPAPVAVQGTLKDFGAAATAVVLIAAISALLLHWTMGGFAVSWLATAASAVSASLIVPLAAASLRFGETFVTGFNRIREMQERLVAPLLTVAHARWGASIAGVGAVVCALGYFGSGKLIAADETHRFAFAVFFAAVATGAVTFWLIRGWRRTCAIIFSFVPSLLLTLWAMTRLHEAMTVALFTGASVAGFALVLFPAIQAANNMRSGNDMGLASARAMERESGVVVAAAIASALVICIGTSDTYALALLMLFSAVAAILLQPALAISLETLFPRRKTIEARYRVR
jgi:hypothetical protein